MKAYKESWRKNEERILNIQPFIIFFFSYVFPCRILYTQLYSYFCTFVGLPFEFRLSRQNIAKKQFSAKHWFCVFVSMCWGFALKCHWFTIMLYTGYQVLCLICSSLLLPNMLIVRTTKKIINWSHLTTAHYGNCSNGSWWSPATAICEMLSGRASFLHYFHAAYWVHSYAGR